MPTKKKAEEIVELTQQLQTSPLGVITDYRGLSVSELMALRRQLRQAGGRYVVAKNTLLGIAAEQAGIQGLEPLLTGPTAVAFSDQHMAEVAKALTDYAKSAKTFAIKGGYLHGRPITAEQIEQIAKLPSREQLLAQVVGQMQAPIAGFVGVLGATLASVVRVLDARRQQLAEQGASA